MNEKGMVRQYFIFGMLLLIAVFILTGIEWGDGSQGHIGDQAISDSTVAQSNSNRQEGSGDLRGGASRSASDVRRSNGDQGEKDQPPGNSASSSPFSAATSTPLQSRSTSNPFAPSDGEDLSRLPQASADLYQS